MARQQWDPARVRRTLLALIVGVALVLVAAALESLISAIGLRVANIQLVFAGFIGWVWLHRVHGNPLLATIMVGGSTLALLWLLLIVVAGESFAARNLVVFLSTGANLMIALFIGSTLSLMTRLIMQRKLRGRGTPSD